MSLDLNVIQAGQQGGGQHLSKIDLQQQPKWAVPPKPNLSPIQKHLAFS